MRRVRPSLVGISLLGGLGALRACVRRAGGCILETSSSSSSSFVGRSVDRYETPFPQLIYALYEQATVTLLHGRVYFAGIVLFHSAVTSLHITLYELR